MNNRGVSKLNFSANGQEFFLVNVHKFAGLTTAVCQGIYLKNILFLNIFSFGPNIFRDRLVFNTWVNFLVAYFCMCEFNFFF